MKPLPKAEWFPIPGPGAFLRLASCLVLGGLLVTGALSCGKKGKSGVEKPVAGDSEEISLHGDGPFVVAQPEQVRWPYSIAPSPDPGHKPAYLLRSFTFEKGSNSLNSEARGVLQDLAPMLKERPGVELLIVSFCDQVAERTNAENLGLQRAKAARDLLISYGVTRERLDMATFGAELAEAGEDEPLGQIQDRRVEIWLSRE